MGDGELDNVDDDAASRASGKRTETAGRKNGERKMEASFSLGLGNEETKSIDPSTTTTTTNPVYEGSYLVPVGFSEDDEAGKSNDAVDIIRKTKPPPPKRRYRRSKNKEKKAAKLKREKEQKKKEKSDPTWM